MTDLRADVASEGVYVPPEAVLLIVKYMRRGDKYDRRVLLGLSLISKAFWTVMHDNRVESIEHYTITHECKNTIQTVLWGSLHSIRDRPATIYRRRGAQVWFRYGRKHRNGDMPAVIRNDGRTEYWVNGKLHRDGDKPAIICANGRCEWYKEGKRHRATVDNAGNMLPAVVCADMQPEWWRNGHRVAGSWQVK